MPVFCLEGVPRSGKSYEAVAEHIIPALKSGRAVVTDIPLNVGELNRLLKTEVDDLVYQLRPGVRSDGRLYRPFDNMADFTWSAPATPGPGVRFWERMRETGVQRPLLVIDEAHEVLGTSTSDKGGPSNEVINWFAMHGHHGYDVVLLTQDHMLLNTGIRRRIEQRFRFVRLEALGSTSRYIRLRYSGVGKGAIERKLRKYNKRIFKAYASMTGGGAISEKRTRPIWLNWKVLLMVGFIVFAITKIATHEGGILPGIRTPEAAPAGEGAPAAPGAPGSPAAPASTTVATEIAELEAEIKREKLAAELACLKTGDPAACRAGQPGGVGGFLQGPGQAWSRGGVLGQVQAWQPRFPYDGWRWSVGGFVEVWGEGTAFLYGHPPQGGQVRINPDTLRSAGWTVEPTGPAGYRLAYGDQAQVVVSAR